MLLRRLRILPAEGDLRLERLAGGGKGNGSRVARRRTGAFDGIVAGSGIVAVGKRLGPVGVGHQFDPGVALRPGRRQIVAPQFELSPSLVRHVGGSDPHGIASRPSAARDVFEAGLLQARCFRDRVIRKERRNLCGDDLYDGFRRAAAGTEDADILPNHQSPRERCDAIARCGRGLAADLAPPEQPASPRQRPGIADGEYFRSRSALRRDASLCAAGQGIACRSAIVRDAEARRRVARRMDCADWKATGADDRHGVECSAINCHRLALAQAIAARTVGPIGFGDQADCGG